MYSKHTLNHFILKIKLISVILLSLIFMLLFLELKSKDIYKGENNN